MRLGDVVDLDHILYVPNLMKILFSISCMTLQCFVKVDGQQVNIRDNSHGSSQVLAKRIQEDGLYKLFTNIIEEVWQDAMIDEGISSLDETLTLESFSIVEETITKKIVKSMNDSLIVVYDCM
jgi:hypothetical protein